MIAFFRSIAFASIALALALAVGLALGASAAEAQSKRKIVIGARDDGRGTGFRDESGRFTGLEGEVLTLITEAMPQYEFEFLFLPQRSLFPSLITRKVDIVHGNLRRTVEREEQAIRTRWANNWWPYVLTVPATDTATQSLKDLEGKRLVQNQNSGQALLAEQYIRENKADIELVYSPEHVTMLADGHADGSFMSPFTFEANNNIYPDFKLRMIDGVELSGPAGTPDGDPNAYFWFRAEDEKLRDEVSEVVKKLRDDGVISRISLRFTGVDYPARIDTEAEKNLHR
jgi:ABC-type amino acid transport substrate-binding protein